MRSGFHTVRMVSGALRPGRRARRDVRDRVYHLHVTDARRWHEEGAHASDDCWCGVSDYAFINRLAERVRAQGYRTPMHWNERDHLVLSGGPGFDDVDDEPIRHAVAQA